MAEEPEIPKMQSAQVLEQDEPEPYLGRALLSEDLPIEMKNVMDDRRIYGFIRQKFVSEIIPNIWNS